MFRRITKEYLQPTSPQEVNISSKMQTKIASVQDNAKFSSLNGDSRRNVLQEPLQEVVRMLGENLLAKFKRTPEMLKRREDLERQDWRKSHSRPWASPRLWIDLELFITCLYPIPQGDILLHRAQVQMQMFLVAFSRTRPKQIPPDQNESSKPGQTASAWCLLWDKMR